MLTDIVYEDNKSALLSTLGLYIYPNTKSIQFSNSNVNIFLKVWPTILPWPDFSLLKNFFKNLFLLRPNIDRYGII